MKKLIFCLIFGSFLTLFQKAEAQTDISFCPKIGYSLDGDGHILQSVIASNPKNGFLNPVYSMDLLIAPDFLEGFGGLGLGMESGNIFRNQYSVIQNDSSILLKDEFIRAAAFYFTGIVFLPVELLREFGGTGAGFSYGLAPDVGNKRQANLAKIFIHLNYNFLVNQDIGTSGEQAYHIGLFFRPSFNFLTMGEQISGKSLEFGINIYLGQKLDE